MEQEIESQLPVKLVRPQIIPIIPRTYEEVYKMGNMLAETDMVPKDFKGKPHNCIVAIQMGLEIGLMPIQAIQNIAVINGRPSLWGDALLALVQASGLLEWIDEVKEDTFCTCEVKRRGDIRKTFQKYTIADAKTAGLWGKLGPWKTSPRRMLQMRARGFALRDKFADILKGIQCAEEQRDIIDIEVINIEDRKAEVSKKKYEESKKKLDDQKPNLEALKDAGPGEGDATGDPPDFDDDLPLGEVPEETDEPKLITPDQGTVFMDKARELKISTKIVIKLLKDNGFSDTSVITQDKFDLMMLGLDNKAENK